MVTTASPNDAIQSSSGFLPKAYFKGHFLPFEDATVSIATHSLHYGTGVLAGIRAMPSPTIPNQILIFRLAAHCQRLCNSAKYLGYDITPATLQSTLIDFVHQNRPSEPFYLRPLVLPRALVFHPASTTSKKIC